MERPEGLLNVEQAAERLGIKPSTIRRYLLERKIGAVKIGKSIRIPAAEIDRLISAGYRPPLAFPRPVGRPAR